MERCYEYLGCKHKDCIMFNSRGEIPCWEAENTLCNHPCLEIIKQARGGKKIEACKTCIYYKAMMGVGRA